jgi:hypothetical protein
VSAGVRRERRPLSDRALVICRSVAALLLGGGHSYRPFGATIDVKRNPFRLFTRPCHGLRLRPQMRLSPQKRGTGAAAPRGTLFQPSSRRRAIYRCSVGRSLCCDEPAPMMAPREVPLLVPRLREASVTGVDRGGKRKPRRSLRSDPGSISAQLLWKLGPLYPKFRNCFWSSRVLIRGNLPGLSHKELIEAIREMGIRPFVPRIGWAS